MMMMTLLPQPANVSLLDDREYADTHAESGNAYSVL
jgi:hypothetical protein